MWVAAMAANGLLMNYERAPNKVLLVDDDPAMRRMISKWLEAAGYRVRTAGEWPRSDCGHRERASANPAHRVGNAAHGRPGPLPLGARQQQQIHYIYTILFTVRTLLPRHHPGAGSRGGRLLQKAAWTGTN